MATSLFSYPYNREKYMYLLVEKEEKEHKYLRKQMNFPAF